VPVPTKRRTGTDDDANVAGEDADFGTAEDPHPVHIRSATTKTIPEAKRRSLGIGMLHCFFTELLAQHIDDGAEP
jgi:hypothetical protein